MKDSEISWTHHTFNPWWGCARVSPACTNCYAETWSHRLGKELWGKNADRRSMSDAYWREPAKWDRAAAKAGERHRVFCASMADVFEARPDLDGHRARLFDLIAATPNLDWLLLTKRPEHMVDLAPAAWADGWPANVWAGTTVEDQKRVDERIPELLKVPARVRFLSCEPLLERITVPGDWIQQLHWVICGGESGAHARPMQPAWARALRDQCRAAGVPFHFKQWGEWHPEEPVVRVRRADGSVVVETTPIAPNGLLEIPEEVWAMPNDRAITDELLDLMDQTGREPMRRVGKKLTGRLLDGELHDAFPESLAWL